ncbi:MAG: lycopene cyclase domain-containing protein [Flavobacteriales bacterium]|nr:lycopene cyclase domain-containing protein [Flavobacteriales bacterium]
MTPYFYLLVNLGCFLVPFLFSFHPRLQFIRHIKATIAGIVVMMLLFIPWDIYFTAQGVWGFNDKYTIGWKVAGLPLEEYLFFICIPYACLFTYHCFQVLIQKLKGEKFYRMLSWFMAVIFLLVAITHMGKAYTFTAHLLAAIFLFVHLFIFRVEYLHRFMHMFVIILIPFIASNGVLTGITFWEYPFINVHPEQITEKIVWYNQEENTGIRIFSMPVDDIAYGLLMLLLSVTVYEKVKSKSALSA